MDNNYHIDLTKKSLEGYKESIKNSYLPPSFRILKENTDKCFETLKQNNLITMNDIQQKLKTKSNVDKFSKESGLPVDYLTILRRDVNTYLPKPVYLNKFRGVDEDVINTLGKFGIKNTLQLFKRILTPKDREKLSIETKIYKDKILKLTKLTDLSRIKWVGPTFASLFYETGLDTAEKISKSTPEEFNKKILEAKKRLPEIKAKIGMNDIGLCIEVAADVPKAITF